MTSCIYSESGHKQPFWPWFKLFQQEHSNIDFRQREAQTRSDVWAPTVKTYTHKHIPWSGGSHSPEEDWAMDSSIVLDVNCEDATSVAIWASRTSFGASDWSVACLTGWVPTTGWVASHGRTVSSEDITADSRQGKTHTMDAGVGTQKQVTDVPCSVKLPPK